VNVERDEPHVEQEDLYADDGHEGYGVRSLFAAGWFRAMLLLTILAVTVVVALPYLLDVFEPATSSVKMSPPVKERKRAVSGPRSLLPSSAGQPRPDPEPSRSAATPGPASARPSTTPPPMLPSSAPPPESASRPLQVVKTGGGGHASEFERPRAVSTRPSPPSSEASATHWVQVGLFKDASNAARLATTLRDQGFSIQVASVTRTPRDATAGGTYHLVRVGAFADEARAAAARDDLKSRGYVGFLTEGAAK
jgi:cell division protein FtsN